MDLQLENRNALVTGGSKGIGLAVTAALVAEGARVTVGSREPTPELEALMTEHDVDHVPVDLAEPDGPGRLVEQAVAARGGLDLLVNNVGASELASTSAEFIDAQWQQLFEVNFFGVVRTVRSATPYLLDGRQPAIVTVASLNARLPVGMIAPYSAAKAALVNYSKAVSEELAPYGVRVNTVSPGPVRTPLWTAAGGFAHLFAARAGITAEEVMDRMVPESMAVSLGRVGKPEEIADLVVFLCSPRAGFITGADHVAGGGMLKSTA